MKTHFLKKNKKPQKQQANRSTEIMREFKDENKSNRLQLGSYTEKGEAHVTFLDT